VSTLPATESSPPPSSTRAPAGRTGTRSTLATSGLLSGLDVSTLFHIFAASAPSANATLDERGEVRCSFLLFAFNSILSTTSTFAHQILFSLFFLPNAHSG
jgi:hypothetical protein